MALLAEEIVEEWLNRQGYFTIRGIRIGVEEIDILAVKLSKSGEPECRHIEVTCSMHPVSYISKLPRDIQRKTGRPANTVQRSKKELIAGVREWIEKKYKNRKKVELLKKLYPRKWSRELVINKVRYITEIDLIKSHRVKIIELSCIVSELRKKTTVVKSARGADLVDLIHLGTSGK